MSAGRDWQVAKKSNPCPACGAPKWCMHGAAGGTCNHDQVPDGCHDGGEQAGGGRLWWYDAPAAPGGDTARPVSKTTKPAGPKRGTPEEIGQVYARLLVSCPLTSEHRDHLTTERRLSPEKIGTDRFASLPSGLALRKVVDTLIDEFGDLLLQVPGFRPGRGGGAEIVAAGSGILIPYMSGDMVSATRLRLDTPGDGGRYRWLSGNGSPSVEQSAYVVRPANMKPSLAVVTEGEFKAAAAGKHWGALSIGVPGVDSYGLALPVLKERGIKTVIVAMDADHRENPHVYKNTCKAVDALRKAGITVLFALWDEDSKGVDDAIHAGIEITELVGDDIDDHLSAVAERLGLVVEVAPVEDAKPAEEEAEGAGAFAKALAKIEECFDFFADNGTAYLSPGKGTATALDSGSARNQVLLKLHRATGKPPSNDTIQRLLALKTAEVILEGPSFPVFRRCGKIGETHYLDLCRQDGKVIEMTADGWHIIDSPPGIYWRRTGSQQEELPVPIPGGDVMLMAKLINAPRTQVRYLATYMAAILRTGLPYPVLVLEGPAGSAKTAALKTIKSIIDPEAALVSTVPKGEQDLAIMCRSSYYVGIDNVSTIDLKMSNSFCRVSTGAHHRTRALYTGTDETILELHRPLVITGLNGIVDQADLASRTSLLNLEAIDPANVLESSEIERMLEEYRPSILGGLLDGFVAGLANLSAVHIAERTRLYDYTRFLCAIEYGFPWPNGEALAVFNEAQDSLYDQAIGKDRVALAVVNLMEYRNKWEGTVGELLGTLLPPIGGEDYWPTTPHKLSRRVVHAVPLLKAKGIGFRQMKKRHGMVFSLFSLDRSSKHASQASQASQTLIDTGQNGHF